MTSYQYRKSHCGDKTVVRSSYLHNGISYTGKMSSLYWIGALIVKEVDSFYSIPQIRVIMRFGGSTFNYLIKEIPKILDIIKYYATLYRQSWHLWKCHIAWFIPVHEFTSMLKLQVYLSYVSCQANISLRSTMFPVMFVPQTHTMYPPKQCVRNIIEKM